MRTRSTLLRACFLTQGLTQLSSTRTHTHERFGEPLKPGMVPSGGKTSDMKRDLGTETNIVLFLLLSALPLANAHDSPATTTPFPPKTLSTKTHHSERRYTATPRTPDPTFVATARTDGPTNSWVHQMCVFPGRDITQHKPQGGHIKSKHARKNPGASSWTSSPSSRTDFFTSFNHTIQQREWTLIQVLNQLLIRHKSPGRLRMKHMGNQLR